jgi:hypothetical protein
MPKYTSEDLVGRFYLHCGSSELRDSVDMDAKGVLAFLKLEGVTHLYLDEPFDAYFVGVHTATTINGGEWLNLGGEWFSTDELEAAQEAFDIRKANIPARAHRGTSACDIGGRDLAGVPAI